MNTVNEQSTAETTYTSTIKFTHADGGEIDFNSGATVFSDLLMIGAFASTKTIKCNKEALWHEYATDNDGVKSLAHKSGEAIDTISDTISSLGMMLAYVDRKEVGDNHLNNYAWLIAGLGELLTQLVRENQEITSSLLITSIKQNTKRNDED